MNKVTLLVFTICVVVLGCVQEEPSHDPKPVLTFQTPDQLICHLESSCFNPAKSSIDIKFPLADGTYIRQSGAFQYTSSDQSIAVADGASLILRSIGECTITVTQYAAPGFNASGSASYKLIVMKKLDPIPTLTWFQSKYYDLSQPLYRAPGDTIKNPATSAIVNGGKIMYFSSDTATARVDSIGNIYCRKAGITKITAMQLAKDDFNQQMDITCDVTVDPFSVITFSEGKNYVTVMESGLKYQNRPISTIQNGGQFNWEFDFNMVRINYAGELELLKPGVTNVTVIQEAKQGVNSRSSGTYQLTIEPPVIALQFENGNDLTVSTVGAKIFRNQVSNLYSEYFKFLNYSSSDNFIATVDNEGIISATNPGTATISATLTNAGAFQDATASYVLHVINYPLPSLFWQMSCCYVCFVDPSSSVCQNKISSSISQGGAIEYSVDNTSIATVDKDTGVITPLTVGYVNIIAEQKEMIGVNGYAQVKTLLTILKNPAKMPILQFQKGTTYTCYVGSSECQNVASSSIPAGGTIIYSSSDPQIATVDYTGKVTTLKAGVCIISAKQLEGVLLNLEATLSYTLTVLE
jgi:uncharacterized protein YjdB